MNRDSFSVLCLVAAWAQQIGYSITTHPALLLGGTLAATAFFVLQFAQTTRIGQAFLALIAVLVLVTLARDTQGYETLWRAASSGLHLVAFIAALSTLRVSAAASALLQRCGAHLMAQRSGSSYAILNFGSMMAATVLLFGVVNLFGTMVAQGASAGPPARRAMSAVLRGYAMMPVWSPIALPFGLLSVHYPEVAWIELLPMSAIAVATIAVVGIMADRLTFAVTHAATPNVTGSAATDFTRLCALVLGLMALIGGVSASLDWSTIRAVIVVVPFVAVIWLASMAGRLGKSANIARQLAVGLAGERSILAVMAGAGTCGVLLGTLVPVERISALLVQVEPAPWLVPPVIVAIFMGLGQVGFSPTLTFITLAVVLPDPDLLGIAPSVFYATILAIWGLASIGTPFSVPAMVTARLFKTTPAAVVYRWSPAFLLGAPGAVAALFALVAAMGAD